MADTLTLKEVELDYEADEVDDGTNATLGEEADTPSPREESEIIKHQNSSENKQDNSTFDGGTLTLKEVELDYEADEADDVRGSRGDDATNGTHGEEGGTPSPREESEILKHQNSSESKQDNSTFECGSLTLKETELDYEADEVDEEKKSSLKEEGEVKKDENSSENKQENASLDGDTSNPAKNEDGEIDSGEELEDGELSDEDPTTKNERLNPKPVCRFYSKGQCSWGNSCRFLHPGVVDKGNYSMFATPRPILPGEPKEQAAPDKTEPVLMARPVPQYESAWERGLRHAKEMRVRSAKRKQMDVEYEEKKSNMSLTQIELDKENDYYMRPASPVRSFDPYADDYPTYDDYDTYSSEVRRIAPPPPPEFLAQEPSSRRYSYSPPPNVRRVAPPRSPSPPQGGRKPQPPGVRRQEDWADPWMRSRDEKRGMAGRRYSSRSSRSSSSGSGRSRSPPSRSFSSHSSSRSRSSTPPGIPRSEQSSRAASKNAAPLQKRLAGAAPFKSKTKVSKTRVKLLSKPLLVPKLETDQHKKSNVKDKEREKKPRSSSTDSGANKSPRKTDGKNPANRIKETKLKDETSKSMEVMSSKPKDPFKINKTKNQIKLTLKTTLTTKPANQTVLEKLGMTNEDLVEAQMELKQKPSKGQETNLKRKIPGQESTDSPQKRKMKIEKDDKKKRIAPAVDLSNPTKSVKPKISEDIDKDIPKDIVNEKDEKKSSASDAQGRRGELLKQLKAVEDAITRKRTKLEK